MAKPLKRAANAGVRSLTRAPVVGRPPGTKADAAAKLIVDGELVLYGTVGGSVFSDEGFSAREVVDALSTLKGDIAVRINSGGGSVFDGVAIYEALKAHRGAVTVHVDGIAASAASVIAMAGKTIVVPDAAMLMIHNAWTVTVGDASDHAKSAGVLEKINGQLADVYAKRAKLKRAYVAELMDDETWMTGGEAVDMGFADRTSEAEATYARFDYSQYRHAPLDKLPRVQPADTKAPTTVRELERALLNIGFSRSRAKEIAGAEFRVPRSPRDDQREREWTDLAAYINTLATKGTSPCLSVH